MASPDVDCVLGISLAPAGTSTKTELMPACESHALGDWWWVAGTNKNIMTMLATVALKPELSTQIVRTVVLGRHLTEEPGLDVKRGQERPLGKEHLS